MALSQPTLTPPPRILVIEDDYANRLLFSDYLTYAGFVVLALADGTELGPTLHAFQPDLLVLDLGLPDPDGYCILEQLQTPGGGPQLPVVVVSGYAFVDHQERALALGVHQYLIKPVRMKHLVQAIQSALVR
ncbi:response regulator [Leptolyngbya sp. BL0902]|uniref:response regulator n=1 Tax=Leptolyngbya sp. BL0902 TaxID=1115757 RepID=UPI0018E76520|nr:response regulator [Leptolyngbya sp. BL0902]QQE63506.1 response regulator [Leptolyngbya sp. BL0902]